MIKNFFNKSKKNKNKKYDEYYHVANETPTLGLIVMIFCSKCKLTITALPDIAIAVIAFFRAINGLAGGQGRRRPRPRPRQRPSASPVLPVGQPKQEFPDSETTMQLGVGSSKPRLVLQRSRFVEPVPCSCSIISRSWFMQLIITLSFFNTSHTMWPHSKIHCDRLLFLGQKF